MSSGSVRHLGPTDFRAGRIRQIVNALGLLDADADELTSLTEDLLAFRVDVDGTIEIDTVDGVRMRCAAPGPERLLAQGASRAEYDDLRSELAKSYAALRELLRLSVRGGQIEVGALYLTCGEFFEEAVNCPR